MEEVEMSAKTFVTKTQWVTFGSCPAVVPRGTEVGAGTGYPVPLSMEPQPGKVSVLEEKPPEPPPEGGAFGKSKANEEPPAPKRR